jgi:hypothetical protein
MLNETFPKTAIQGDSETATYPDPIDQYTSQALSLPMIRSEDFGGKFGADLGSLMIEDLSPVIRKRSDSTVTHTPTTSMATHDIPMPHQMQRSSSATPKLSPMFSPVRKKKVDLGPIVRYDIFLCCYDPLGTIKCLT